MRAVLRIILWLLLVLLVLTPLGLGLVPWQAVESWPAWIKSSLLVLGIALWLLDWLTIIFDNRRTRP